MTSPANAREGRQALPRNTVLHGRYRLEHPLGPPGDVGVTYLARDTALYMPVAVKELLPAGVVTRSWDGTTVVPLPGARGAVFREALRRYVAQARELSKLDHPGLVGVHAVLEACGTAYLVTDYYQGETLDQYLRRVGGPIPWRMSTEIAIRILDGLKVAHARGVAHYDVRPANVFLRTQGGPVLLDFGAARQAIAARGVEPTESLLAAGYAAIEQYGSRRPAPGPRADVYAVCALLYRLVTGQRPPAATDRAGEDPLVAPSQLAADVPAGLEQAMLRGLAVDPAMRPATAAELQDLLERALSSSRGGPTPGGRQQQHPVRRPRTRGVGPALLGVSLVLMLSAAAVWFASRGSSGVTVAAASLEPPLLAPPADSLRAIGAGIAAADSLLGDGEYRDAAAMLERAAERLSRLAQRYHDPSGELDLLEARAITLRAQVRRACEAEGVVARRRGQEPPPCG